MTDVTAYRELLASHDYGIVDRTAVMPELWRELPLHPLVPDALHDSADLMPALLPLKALTAEQIASICDNYEVELENHDRRDYLLSCLLAPASPDAELKALVRHLSDRLVLLNPQGLVFLRYFDSRVFTQLRWLFKPEQMRALFGPFQTWTFRFQDDWLSMTAPDVPEVGGASWRVDASDQAALSRVGFVNVALSQRRAQLERPWSGLAEYDLLAKQAGSAIERAQRDYGLESEADLVAFAQHALAYGENFYLHPRFEQLMRDVRQNPHAGYAYEAAQLEDAEWALIAAESRHLRAGAKSE
jgi:hypothetical protein